ncbi:MAG: hypothetical protein CME62_17690 [Halobacteriovoraceae bacterium]|nr:hypothetical protein [Halobacteriovoraceae bacterium]|tara:strand:+ start:4614 stop:5357 length:744 start_codon:yes stop_codon:yes gene_type:complete
MQQPQIHVPQLSKFNKILIGVYVVAFILNSLMVQGGGINLLNLFGLSLAGVKNLAVFQVVTYPLIDRGLMQVIFNSLILWFIGSELEQRWGTKFYAKFLAVAVVAGAACYLLLASTVGIGGILNGMTGVNLALFVAYAIIYSERTLLFMLIFPMKAKYFCMLLAAIEIYMGMFSANGNAAWAHLASMLFGFLFLKMKSLQARGVTLSALKEEHHRNKMRQKLKIVKDEEEAPKTPKKPDPNNPKYWQ